MHKSGLIILILCTSIANLFISPDFMENDPDSDYRIVYFIPGKGNQDSASAFSAFIRWRRSLYIEQPE
jgi:hypothetical protein